MSSVSATPEPAGGTRKKGCSIICSRQGYITYNLYRINFIKYHMEVDAVRELLLLEQYLISLGILGSSDTVSK